MSIFIDHKMLKHLLKKLKDVLIVSPADGEVLTYEAATGRWKNKAPTAGAAHGAFNLEGTTDIGTNSATFSAMLGENTKTSSLYLNVVANKLLFAFFGGAFRTDVDGTVGDFYVGRSGIAGGYPSVLCTGGSVYMPFAEPTPYEYRQFPIALIAVLTPLFTGRMNFCWFWRSPNGTSYVYNDGNAGKYRRRAFLVQLLA